MCHVSLFIYMPCSLLLIIEHLKKQPYLPVFENWLLAGEDHQPSFFVHTSSPGLCVWFPPNSTVYMAPFKCCNCSVLPWLLLKALYVLLCSPACSLLPQVPAGLKSSCSSHVVQQVPLLSGTQSYIQTMSLFPSVVWVRWDRNQPLSEPPDKPECYKQVEPFSLCSEGGTGNWVSSSRLCHAR